ncbi:MAG: N-acyl amino acid synthase FeeM domain-containing protein [Paracoccaceae bacterium]
MKLILADSDDLLKAAYGLRYRSYLDANAISASEKEVFSDGFDGDPNTFTFLLVWDETPVASIRGCVQFGSQSKYIVPAWQLYERELQEVLSDNFVLVESNRFVTEPGNHTISHAGVFIGISEVANQNNCTDVCTAVRVNQISFYERFFGMTCISIPKKYHGINVEMCLMWASRRNFKWSGLDRLRKHVDFDKSPLSDTFAKKKLAI